MHKLNTISIKEYLYSQNIHPVKDRGYYGMYHSLFRADNNASLKVDFSKNLWIDFGSNEGGTLIDLVMRINNCTVGEAVTKLERQYGSIQADSFSFQGNDNFRKEEPSISIQKVIPLSHPSLLHYLTERCVNVDIAKQHCLEVRYSTNGRNYFAIGFKNDSDGWILRSEYFKGCTSMDITTYSNRETDKDCYLVFEGFMDYLSYLTLKGFDKPKTSTVILNSTSNLSKAMDFIKSYSKVYTYLDNDEGGRKTTQIIRQACPAVIDQSVKYAEHKDLNEYLISTKQAQKEMQIRKPSRGFKR